MTHKCCENEKRRLVESGGGRDFTEGQIVRERSTVTVCANCGEFRVFLERNGVQMTKTFHIWTEDTLRAAAVPINEDNRQAGLPEIVI